MKNKNLLQTKKKLSLVKEKVAVLNDVKLTKIIGGNVGPGDPSWTYTQPSGGGH